MRNKKNMVIGLLCVALVFMGVGYSLLQSTLNISGTAKSIGSFNVQITNVTMKEKSNNNVTDTTEYPGYTNGGKDANLSAKFNAPGDYITYTIEVSNLGSIDAIVKSAVNGTSENDEYFDMSCKLKRPRDLPVGEKTEFDCTITYDKNYEVTSSTVPTVPASMMVTVEAVQKSTSGIEVTAYNPEFMVNKNGVIVGYNGGSDVVIPDSYPEAVPVGDPTFDLNKCISTVSAMYGSSATTQQVESMCNDTKTAVENGSADAGTISFLEANAILVYEYEEGNPITITAINEAVFKSSEITNVDFSKATHLETIGEDAFMNNKISGTITIPASVKTIEKRAFARSNTDTQNIISGLVFESGSKLETIGTNAFYNLGIGGALMIPQGVTTVGDSAFYGNNFESLIIPSSVRTIGDSAFSHNRFSSIDLSNASNLETIGNYSFSNSGNCEDILIPSNVKSIGEYAFNQTGVSNLDLSNATNLETIGIYAFYNSKIGGTVVIPSGVTSIGDFAFDINQIETLNFASNSSLQTIGRCAFEANKIKAVTIPSSVTTIDGNAFYNNSIETINIGSGVRTIGDKAFVNNTVQTIYIDMSQNEWNENVRFKDSKGNISTSAVWYGGNPTIRYKTQ